MKKLTPLKYIVIFALGFYPLIWFLRFRTSIIDGLDTNFPLDPLIWFTRRLFIWNDVLNGGLHFSSSVAGLFFHFLQVVPYLAGFPIQIVEILNILFWSLSIIFAAFVFAKTFISKRFIVQLFFVALYAFNIYLFNTWENIKVANLSLMVGLPLLLSLLKLIFADSISWTSAIFYSCLVGIVSAGTGINPAYFICLLLGAGLFVLVQFVFSQNRIQLLKKSLVVFLPFGLVNLFWIVPLVDYLFITNTVQTLEGIGFTNWVASLSANTSLLNVIRLQGAWDWYIVNDYGVPLYIPYAAKYFYSVPFIVFSFVTPFLAFAAFTLRKNAKFELYFYFALMTVIGVFLGAGLHEPTGYIFNYLLNHLPFFSFFRSPWYIFTPYTILGLGGLACLFIDSVFYKFERRFIFRKVAVNHILFIGTGVLVLSQLVYSYPLITGKIFRPGRDDSFYQTFPSYLHEAREMLESSSYSRMVTYPDDQLESFKWGYKGTESILGLFTKNEVIAPSYNYPNQYLAALVERFYSYLKRGEYQSAFQMAHILGVDSMFIKTDTITLAPNILKDVASFTNSQKDISEWHFMNINEKYSSLKFSVPQYVFTLDMSPKRLADVSRFIPKDAVVVARDDSQLEKIPEVVPNLTVISEAKKIEETNPSITKFTYTTKDTSEYSLYLNNYQLRVSDISVSVDGKQVSSQLMTSDENVIKIGPLTTPIGDHSVVIRLPSPKVEQLIGLDPLLVIGEPGISTAKKYAFNDFSPFKKYEIQYESQYVYGDVPRFELVQSGPNSPYRVEKLPLLKNQDWLSQKFIFTPVELGSKLEIFALQPSQKDHTSKTLIRNLSVKEISDNQLYVIQTPKLFINNKVNLSANKINPTKYSVNVKDTPNGYFLLMKEGYHKGWTIGSKDYIGGAPVHMSGNGYSNLWYIPVGGKNQDIELSFSGQKLYMFGLTVSLIVLLASLTTFIYGHVHRKQKSR